MCMKHLYDHPSEDNIKEQKIFVHRYLLILDEFTKRFPNLLEHRPFYNYDHKLWVNDDMYYNGLTAYIHSLSTLCIPGSVIDIHTQFSDSGSFYMNTMADYEYLIVNLPCSCNVGREYFIFDGSLSKSDEILDWIIDNRYDEWFTIIDVREGQHLIFYNNDTLDCYMNYKLTIVEDAVTCFDIDTYYDNGAFNVIGITQ